MSLDPLELERFVAELAAAPEHRQHAVGHARDLRVYEQVWDDEEVDVSLICWSDTPRLRSPDPRRPRHRPTTTPRISRRVGRWTLRQVHRAAGPRR
ncbi:MAG: hypothetical protein JO262_15015 [Solirubrobacterales bacterium]|nr:hypothetical protein [Solirubrobacterales bacterium]